MAYEIDPLVNNLKGKRVIFKKQNSIAKLNFLSPTKKKVYLKFLVSKYTKFKNSKNQNFHELNIKSKYDDEHAWLTSYSMI